MQNKYCDNDWTKSLYYASDYLNIHSILALNEKVACKVKVFLPKIGALLKTDNLTKESNNRNFDIPVNTKLELPLWIALALESSRRSLLLFDIPPIYKEQYREIFAADPTLVDLQKKAPYYYIVGCNLASISHPEIPAVLFTNLKVYQLRGKMLLEAALNMDRNSMIEFVSKLDNTELAIFRSGIRERNRLEKWTTRCHNKLEAILF